MSDPLKSHGLYSPVVDYILDWFWPDSIFYSGGLYSGLILQARILKWIAFLSPGYLPNPGIKPRSPALQVDSLPAEPPWEPTNTGAGSLSLLQQIFLIQELNQGLLHCRNNVKRWSILSYLLLFGHFESKSFAAPQTVACHAPLSMGFHRQEYWSGSHSLLQGIFPTQG